MKARDTWTENRPLRILVADADTNVRFALSVLLGRQTGYRVQGEAANADSLLALVDDECPDAMVLDWEIAGSAMEALVTRMRRRCPDVAVVVLSGRLGIREIALAAGADRFVSKAEPPGKLPGVIRSAVESRQVIQGKEEDHEEKSVS